MTKEKEQEWGAQMVVRHYTNVTAHGYHDTWDWIRGEDNRFLKYDNEEQAVKAIGSNPGNPYIGYSFRAARFDNWG